MPFWDATTPTKKCGTLETPSEYDFTENEYDDFCSPLSPGRPKELVRDPVRQVQGGGGMQESRACTPQNIPNDSRGEHIPSTDCAANMYGKSPPCTIGTDSVNKIFKKFVEIV